LTIQINPLGRTPSVSLSHPLFTVARGHRPKEPLKRIMNFPLRLVSLKTSRSLDIFLYSFEEMESFLIDTWFSGVFLSSGKLATLGLKVKGLGLSEEVVGPLGGRPSRFSQEDSVSAGKGTLPALHPLSIRPLSNFLLRSDRGWAFLVGLSEERDGMKSLPEIPVWLGNYSFPTPSPAPALS